MAEGTGGSVKTVGNSRTLMLTNVIAHLLLAVLLRADPCSERREALRKEMTEGVLVIWGANEREHELTGQRSDFFYLTGLDQANAALLLFPEGKRLHPRGKALAEILYLPDRDSQSEMWTGKVLGPDEEAEKATGIEKVLDISRLNGHLEGFLLGETLLYVSADMAGLDAPLTRDQIWINSLRERNPFIAIKDLSPTLAVMRQVKSPEELDAIRKAIELTGRAIDEAMKIARPGIFEYQIESTVLYFFRYLGGEGPSFPPIVGSGPNSAVLHYSKNDRRMEEGDLIVLDIGARFGHYAADITRTVPVSGYFTPEQAEIYDIVLEAQRLAIEKIRPGASYREDIDQTARNYIREKGYEEYFTHGVGHFVGLEVHDAGDYESPLQPGMVLTIEPGIYLPDKEIGVRIEDMVLVTESGCEILSGAIPRARSEIEAAMQGALDIRLQNTH